ncbi:hypothetical protein FBZ98_103625 [Rhizobium sp. ERR 922]|nr:hypothetical protein FBZ98_103625 [Rhizobium sp. ERR 922]TWB97436.1 hypothetical protein FBZ97_103258 [Rhizobium sp. ERR 942]
MHPAATGSFLHCLCIAIATSLLHPHPGRSIAYELKLLPPPLLPSGRRCRQADEGVPAKRTKIHEFKSIAPSFDPSGHLLPEGRRSLRCSSAPYAIALLTLRSEASKGEDGPELSAKGGRARKRGLSHVMRATSRSAISDPWHCATAPARSAESSPFLQRSVSSRSRVRRRQAAGGKSAAG